MKTLNILVSVYLDKKNYFKWGIDYYLKYFDKIKIFYIDEGYHFKIDKIFYHRKIKVIRIDSFYKIFKLFNIKSNDRLFLDFALSGIKSFIIKIILYFKKKKRIIFKLANIPQLKISKKSYLSIINRMIFKRISMILFNFLEKNFLSKHNIYFCAGKKFEKEYKSFNIIKTHSWDFNEKLKTNFNKVKLKNYFLYFDQYEHNHPDYLYFKRDTIDPVPFYKSLNNFFEFLEKKFNMDVIIAAHPKASVNSYKKYYKRRKIYFNKTLELTRNCFATLVHDTTAVSYSVIYEKPTIFLINNEMLRARKNRKKFIEIFSRTLGSAFVNIDKKDDLSKIKNNIKEINNKRYKNYFNNYIFNSKENKNKNKNKKIETLVCNEYLKTF